VSGSTSGAAAISGRPESSAGALAPERTDPVGVAFRTLGCKVNRAEAETIAAELLGLSAHVVDEADARVVVVSTCAVTGEADAKARKAVRHALRLPSAPVVVVTGCGVVVDPEAVSALGDRVVVEPDKDRVASRVSELLRLSAMPPVKGVRAGEGFRTRALLKVQDGCDAFCSYCIVPHARGVPRGVPLDQIAAQAAELVDSGAREIVMTGINIGRFSDGDAGLADAVEAIAASGVERLRLSSIEPLDLTPALLGVLSSTPSFCPHLHVPLQSGSDAVLSAMGRRYTTAEYAERIADARASLPGLAITTDVLCGFPGERDEDAEGTLRFCEAIGFSSLHVFRFSARPGTPAALLPERIDPRTAAARASLLRACGERQRAKHAASRAGSLACVLIETVGADGVGSGTTEDYLRVAVRHASALVGRTVEVRLAQDADGALWGEPKPGAC
jgi:threonylcarbamoyladenosine tRNA methylthiotransferase MtaB